MKERESVSLCGRERDREREAQKESWVTGIEKILNDKKKKKKIEIES